MRCGPERSDCWPIASTWEHSFVVGSMRLDRWRWTWFSQASRAGLMAWFPALPVSAAAGPIQTYRGSITEEGPRADANEAWLDLQVERLSTAIRLRGQVTCDDGAEGAVAHLIDASTGEVVASEAIADDGTFTITAACREATLAIELEAGEAALVVRGLVLRT